MDSQRLFSIQVPSAWNLKLVEGPGDDPGTYKSVSFEFPDNTPLFTISVSPTSSLSDWQSGDGPQPVFLGESSQYIFGTSSGEQVAITWEPISYDEMTQTLPQILGTFKVL